MRGKIRFLLYALLLALAVSCGGGGEEKGRGSENPRPGTPEARTPVQRRVHPAFDFTEEGLSELVRGSSAPDSAKTAIIGAPRDFLELLLPALGEDAEYLVLVDKRHALSPSYEPADLKNLDDFGVTTNRRGLKMREKAGRSLAAMAAAAKKDGVVLVASSAYRSFSYQKTVYERNVKQMGKEAADRESAMPGHSQHQLGTAIDFGSIDDSFASTPASRWLRLHAEDFGFSLSFPEGLESVTGYRHESWHYRFVGKAAAALERRFFGGVQQRFLEFIQENREAFLQARKP